MQGCQQVLCHVNLYAFKKDIPSHLWKQTQKGKYPLAQRKSFNLNLHACMKDVRPDWLKQGQKQKKELVRLPIVVHGKGSSLQYAWDGQRLLLVKDLERNDAEGMNQWLKNCIKRMRFVTSSIFVPQQVQSNYIHYLKWKFVHRIFSSALQVQATQAMLQSIGIGAKRSLPSAAALNWVLKDGLGRLSKFIFTASLGPAFDADLKRVRFSTSVLFSLSIGVELLTLIFPQKFLLLATIANIAKSISMAAYVATSSAIHRSFAIADNLGDVSAKAQIQTVCFDNIGLALAASLNLLCKNNPRIEAVLPFVTYPFFSAIDLYAIYQGLKYVHLSTLNKARLEIIADKWLHSKAVPSAAEVSNMEGRQFFKCSGNRQWPLRIGSVNPKDGQAEVLISVMKSLRNKDKYFFCVELSNYGFLRKPQMGLLLCLHERAMAADIVMGMLQASYIRVALRSRENSLSLSMLPKREEDYINSRSVRSEDPVTLKPESVLTRDWQNLLEESKRYASVEVIPLLEQMKRSGWVVKHVLLSPSEQVTYSVLGEDGPSLA
eukprot:Gb_07487 [translate_table: standard]